MKPIKQELVYDWATIDYVMFENAHCFETKCSHINDECTNCLRLTPFMLGLSNKFDKLVNLLKEIT